jgi:hypothetical protein
MNIEVQTSRMQQERPSRIGLGGRPGGQELWSAGHTLPQKILIFCPKFPYKSLNSVLPLILEIWKENFWKQKSYTKDNYAIRVAQTYECNYSVLKKSRTSTSSKSWGFGSRKFNSLTKDMKSGRISYPSVLMGCDEVAGSRYFPFRAENSR